MFVIINIGSNLGNRRLNLSKAMAAVGREFGPFEMSHVVETKPWGFDSPHNFLNVAIMFQTDLNPEEVLQRLQAIEKTLNPESHRKDDGSYADRKVDIDIVAMDDKVVDTPLLKVPHPHLAERDFFLLPLKEIAPGWRHPVTGLNAEEMLSALPSSETENQ